MIYKGSCHCGKVAFEVEGELTGAMACNCSICSRKGCRARSVGGRARRVASADFQQPKARSVVRSSPSLFVASAGRWGPLMAGAGETAN